MELVQDKHELEAQYPLPHIRSMRLGVCKRVFEKFLNQLAKVNFLNLIEEKSVSNKGWMKLYPIGTPEPNENGTYFAVVEHNMMADSYCCECEYFKKSGIACSHILKILIKQGRSFLDYAVAKQWKIEPEEMVMHRELQ